MVLTRRRSSSLSPADEPEPAPGPLRRDGQGRVSAADGCGMVCIMNLDARTADFFNSVAAQDVDAVTRLCASDFRLKQNNAPDHGFDAAIAGLRGLWDAGVTTSYSEVRRAVADRVITEQHVVTLTRSDGVTAACDVCVVVRFDDDGLISRIDEYADSAAFAPVFN